MQTGCPSLRQVQLSVEQPFHPALSGACGLAGSWAGLDTSHTPRYPAPCMRRAHTHPPKGLHSRGPSPASFWEPLLAYLPRLPLPKQAELQMARPGTMLRAFALGTALTCFYRWGRGARLEPASSESDPAGHPDPLGPVPSQSCLPLKQPGTGSCCRCPQLAACPMGSA